MTTEPVSNPPELRTAIRSPRIVAYGEVLIDLLQSGKELTWHMGGAPANAAIAASRLGIDTGLVASVGDDYYGRFILSQLRQYNVNCGGVAVREREPTSLAFIFLDANGNQSDFLFYRHADLLIDDGQLEAASADYSGIFCFGSLSLTGGPVRHSLDDSLGRYHKGDGTVVFDVNVRPSLWENMDAWVEAVQSFLPKCHVLKLNQSEACTLCGCSDPLDAINYLSFEKQQLLIITLGHNGCYYKTPTSSGHVPGFDIDTSGGDAVGAGDAFVGTLCWGLASAADRSAVFYNRTLIEEVLRRANAAGAITASIKGAIAPKFDLDTINNLLQDS